MLKRYAKRLLRVLLPKRWRTIIILQITLSLAICFVVNYHRRHPSFFYYVYHAQSVDRLSNTAGNDSLLIWDKPERVRTGGAAIMTEDTYWEWPCRIWIRTKKLLGIDLGCVFP